MVPTTNFKKIILSLKIGSREFRLLLDYEIQKNV